MFILALCVFLYVLGSLLTVVAFKCAGWWDNCDDNEPFILTLWPIVWLGLIIVKVGEAFGNGLMSLADKIVARICPNRKR